MMRIMNIYMKIDRTLKNCINKLRMKKISYKKNLTL